MAYTYLIGWVKQNIYYYGARYAKGCDPSDLWVKYFTSSDRVKQIREEYGEPDIIQVRHQFDNKNDCLKWEEKVIRRIDAVNNPKWLNLQNAGSTFHNNGFPRDNICRDRIREARQKRFEEDPEFREKVQMLAREVSQREEVRKAIKDKAIERFKDPKARQVNIDTHNTEEYKKRTSDIHKAQYANDEKYRRTHQASINTQEYRDLQSKLTRERMQDPENRKKISESMKASLASPEKRQKMSEAAKISSAKRIATRERNKAMKLLKEDPQ